jgi:acetoacetate decarboxylase
MGYVKTVDEVEQVRRLLRANHTYASEAVSMYFRTDPDFVKAVLPPCFTPAPGGQAQVKIGSAATTQAGMLATEFRIAALYVLAQFGEFEGWYHLTMLLTGDMPITIGRELWGEAKKRGEVVYQQDGNTGHGHAERNGATLIQMDWALSDEEQVPESPGRCSLNVKAVLDATGQTLQHDPIVVVSRPTSTVESYRSGTGTFELASSESDPCGSVPVLEAGRVEFVRQLGHYGHGYQTFPAPGDRDEYLPYVLGRSYDIQPLKG